MKRFRIGICDDDAADLITAAELVHAYDRSGSLELTEYSDPLELMQEQQLPDILLLDIEMEKLNGLEVARKLGSRPDAPVILFTARNDSYAAEGYGLALRFLRKPLNPTAFFEAMDAAVTESIAHRMTIQVGEARVTLRLSEILYLEAQGHYVMVHTLDSEYRIRTTIRDAAAGLPQLLFASPHKSYIVNLEQIRKAAADGLTLVDGTEIPVSRSKAETFNRIFYRFLGR